MALIRLLLTVVVLAVLATAGVYAAAQNGLISEEYLNKVPGLSSLVAQPQVADVLNNSQDGIKILSSTAQSTAESAGQVLGSQVEVGEQPLPQRAFEFARYSYCQEVVKDYEKRYPQE